MSLELIDTHAHLDFPQFDADREDVIHRAEEVGVTRIMNIGVDLRSSQKSVELAEKHDGVFAAVGVHPHDSKSATPEVVAEICGLLHRDRVVAVGEIGLDYYRDHSPREVQRQVFRRFLGLARESDLPVIIHTRNAWDDVVGILREESAANSRGVIHCFSGDATRAGELIEMGFHVSFTGVLTFKNSRAVDVLARVPLERLLLETDCPYMAPEPHRGKRNEPAYVRFTAQKVAQIKSVAVDEVAKTTTANALALFGMV